MEKPFLGSSDLSRRGLCRFPRFGTLLASEFRLMIAAFQYSDCSLFTIAATMLNSTEGATSNEFMAGDPKQSSFNPSAGYVGSRMADRQSCAMQL